MKKDQQDNVTGFVNNVRGNQYNAKGNMHIVGGRIIDDEDQIVVRSHVRKRTTGGKKRGPRKQQPTGFFDALFGAIFGD